MAVSVCVLDAMRNVEFPHRTRSAALPLQTSSLVLIIYTPLEGFVSPPCACAVHVLPCTKSAVVTPSALKAVSLTHQRGLVGVGLQNNDQ